MSEVTELRDGLGMQLLTQVEAPTPERDSSGQAIIRRGGSLLVPLELYCDHAAPCNAVYDWLKREGVGRGQRCSYCCCGEREEGRIKGRVLAMEGLLKMVVRMKGRYALWSEYLVLWLRERAKAWRKV